MNALKDTDKETTIFQYFKTNKQKHHLRVQDTFEIMGWG